MPGMNSGLNPASGFGPGGSVWVLLGEGRAQTIVGDRGQPWSRAADAVRGERRRGAGDRRRVLARRTRVVRSLLTVWRLAGAAWAKVQVINVPIEYGSSS